MVKSIIEGVSAWMLQCPILRHGPLRVDAMGDQPTEYAIETGIYTPVIENYIDGSSDRRFQFSFGSREYYSMDRIQNIANSTFYEDLADWIDRKNKAGELPELPEGCHPESITTLSPGYMFDETGKNARYQIQIELTYHKEA